MTHTPLKVSKREIRLMREVFKAAAFKMVEEAIDRHQAVDGFLRATLSGQNHRFHFSFNVDMAPDDLILIKTLANGKQVGKEVRDAVRRLQRRFAERAGP